MKPSLYGICDDLGWTKTVTGQKYFLLCKRSFLSRFFPFLDFFRIVTFFTFFSRFFFSFFNFSHPQGFIGSSRWSWTREEFLCFSFFFFLVLLAEKSFFFGQDWNKCWLRSSWRVLCLLLLLLFNGNKFLLVFNYVLLGLVFFFHWIISNSPSFYLSPFWLFVFSDVSFFQDGGEKWFLLFTF